MGYTVNTRYLKYKCYNFIFFRGFEEAKQLSLWEMETLINSDYVFMPIRPAEFIEISFKISRTGENYVT